MRKILHKLKKIGYILTIDSNEWVVKKENSEEGGIEEIFIIKSLMHGAKIIELEVLCKKLEEKALKELETNKD